MQKIYRSKDQQGNEIEQETFTAEMLKQEKI